MSESADMRRRIYVTHIATLRVKHCYNDVTK